jgi:uncharacterized protein (TIGR03083 family)
MQLIPRYGTDPLIKLDGPPPAIAGPTIRQRQRLTTALHTLTEEQWTHPSRCDGWTNRDVVVHLDSTNTFWTYSISSGLRGEPTSLLTNFDPVASPAKLVADSQDISSVEMLERFTTSTESLVTLLASLDDEDWSAIAEAPPGHLDIGAVAHHALWDSWIHERDIFLPLRITPDLEDDEVAACLRYAAALGPAIRIARGSTDTGTLAITATSPDISIVVEIGDHVAVGSSRRSGDLCLTGDAVELVESLTVRRPLEQQVPAELSWMLAGLAELFDAEPNQ